MNKNQDYQDFIMALQVAQDQDGKEPWLELPNHAAQQMVDSILALVMALVATPPLDRRNGTAVMSNLLDLDFNGVSGRVRFTSDGDREDPQYSLFNLKRIGDTMSWEDIGSTRSVVGSAEISLKDTCFAPNACGLNIAPLDSYPIPEPAPVQLQLQGWLCYHHSRSISTRKYLSYKTLSIKIHMNFASLLGLRLLEKIVCKSSILNPPVKAWV